MDPTRTGPIALSEQRLRWLEARQRVLSQNIANADSPGYRPSDMQPFAKVLSRSVATPALLRLTVPTQALRALAPWSLASTMPPLPALSRLESRAIERGRLEADETGGRDG